ncbi:TlyA family RNA methyltransferase [Acetatifactor aquisgranensis]|uniref:TlyA family RNA methyltransferase n=1 Tax=Acetatifactor aquisgranensis TaxID=2941233 RepID=UPI00203AFFD5|nr:TlyA family RNA methyltransferase [Acetatifactor aquisgranensis]
MKERLDVILVKRGYAASREKARAVIMSGNVYVNGQKEDKAGTFFDEARISLEVRESALRYVSRGGLKLEKAMDTWDFSLEEKVCMDIGASTGGFTDCMLQKGAAKVYAVDVGHGQLAWKLRNDERVVCMEQTNFRYMLPEDIGEPLDFASADVSFISLTKILIPARNLLMAGGEMVCLVKPQFEAGREKVGKKGVVREPSVHKEVIRKIVDFAGLIGFCVLHLDYSPVRGPEGNIEYLLHLRKKEEPSEAVRELSEHEAEEQLKAVLESGVGLSRLPQWESLIGETVAASHARL